MALLHCSEGGSEYQEINLDLPSLPNTEHIIPEPPALEFGPNASLWDTHPSPSWAAQASSLLTLSIPRDSPGLALPIGLDAVTRELVEGLCQVPEGGVGREGRGQWPGPSSAPSGQSQTPSHSCMVPMQVPSSQDTSPDVQLTCPEARGEEVILGLSLF